jgi:hypothetical protein
MSWHQRREELLRTLWASPNPVPSATLGRVNDYLRIVTTLLGEKLRSALPGYRVHLAEHPALDAGAMVGAGAGVRPRAVVVSISDPQLHLVVWARTADVDEEPWTDRAVEVRVVLRTDDGEGAGIAAMVGDVVGFDELDELPLREILDVVRVLLFEELPLEVLELVPPVQLALLQARRVHLNDPIG